MSKKKSKIETEIVNKSEIESEPKPKKQVESKSKKQNEIEYARVFDKQEVYILSDIDFISLIKKFFKTLTTEDIYEGFNWSFGGMNLYFSVKKNSENSNNREDEKDFFQWFVNNDKIPEGNYLLMIS